MKEIKIITRAGTEISLEEWQKLYDLEEGSDLIGRHFSYNEYRFQKDIEDFGELVVNELLMRVLDAFRDVVKQPVKINSFNRDDAKQKELRSQGFKTATHSPHVVKMAADIDTNSAEQSRNWALMLQRVSIDTKIKIRIGYEQYIRAGSSFVHVDVCPEYYAAGKPFHHMEHPKAWEQVIAW